MVSPRQQKQSGRRQPDWLPAATGQSDAGSMTASALAFAGRGHGNWIQPLAQPAFRPAPRTPVVHNAGFTPRGLKLVEAGRVELPSCERPSDASTRFPRRIAASASRGRPWRRFRTTLRLARLRCAFPVATRCHRKNASAGIVRVPSRWLGRDCVLEPGEHGIGVSHDAGSLVENSFLVGVSFYLLTGFLRSQRSSPACRFWRTFRNRNQCAPVNWCPRQEPPLNFRVRSSVW